MKVYEEDNPSGSSAGAVLVNQIQNLREDTEDNKISTVENRGSTMHAGEVDLENMEVADH